MAKISGSTEYAPKTELDPGVYASKSEVTKIENKSNHPTNEKVITVGAKNFEPEICIIVTLKSEDGFERDQMLFGKYVKDKVTGKITGWIIKGNAVLSFFYACIGKENVDVNDDWSIPQSLINKCIGKTIWKIDYVNREYTAKDGSTKAGYQTLNTFFSENTTPNTLVEYWYERRTSLKDYKPEIYHKLKPKREEDTSFKFGANAEPRLNSMDDDEAMV